MYKGVRMLYIIDLLNIQPITSNILNCIPGVWVNSPFSLHGNLFLKNDNATVMR